MRWTLAESALLKSMDGSYRLAPKGSGTEVTYELAVDLSIPMIGLLKQEGRAPADRHQLKDLKKRVEAFRG